jgi:hypothetical protein
LREDNRIYEIKESDKVAESFRDSNASKAGGYVSNFYSVQNMGSTSILLKIKNEEKIEWFLYVQKFLRRLRDTEFII